MEDMPDLMSDFLQMPYSCCTELRMLYICCTAVDNYTEYCDGNSPAELCLVMF